MLVSRSRAGFVIFVYACPMCEIKTIYIYSVDNRPFLTGSFNGVKLKCLIDTGASVSCMSKLSFDAIPNHDSLESVQTLPGFRLSAATGHNFSLIVYYQFEFRVLGRDFTRPFFVIAGLSKCEAILGIDFICEIIN